MFLKQLGSLGLKMGRPFASIIIANYNGEQFLPNCFKNLLKTNYRNFEVLVVDDGSSDSSIKVVRAYQKKDKRIKLFKSRKNVGASASRNKGIKKSDGEIIVFLDNDTEVTPNWLEELINPLLEASEIGATCPKMPMMTDKTRISTAGLKLVPHTGWGIALGGREQDVGQRDKVDEVVSISATLAVKREVLDKIGGFDEQLAVHTEDLDFSWRIWLAGYKILYVPKSIVYHYAKPISEREQLMGATISSILFHINKNTYRTLIKNYSLPYLMKYLPVALAINFGRALKYLVRLEPVGPIAFVKAIVWNIKVLPDTLRQRRFIQGIRKADEGYLYEKIMVHEPIFTIIQKYYLE